MDQTPRTTALRRHHKENEMRYRLLGRTGLYVSEICLGTMTYGGKGRWEVVGQYPGWKFE